MDGADALDYTFDDRVAHQYEAQRAHPDAVAGAIGRAIVSVVGADSTILELGIGTGRIARPIAQTGCHVAGIDLSRQMLERTRHLNAGASLALCQADMHCLPFVDAQFDAALAVHVLHLAQNVGGVLAEAARVVRASGWMILGRDWVDPDSVAGRFQMQLRRTVLEFSPDMAPPGAGSHVAKLLTSLGFTPAGEEIAAEWNTHQTPAAILASIAARTHPESWILTDALLLPVVERLSGWARQEWPDLEESHPIPRKFLLAKYRRNR